MSVQYTGYSGVIWQTVSQTLILYNQQLAAVTAASSVVSAAVPTNSQLSLESQAVFQTLLNATEAINVQSLYTAWNYEISQLQAIASLALTLDPATQNIFTNRLVAYEQAAAALGAYIIEPPYQLPSSILTGVPSISQPGSAQTFPGLLGFFEQFDYETPPGGVIINPPSLLTLANQEAQAWQTVANAILVFQGNQINQLYDTALREYQCAWLSAYLLNNLNVALPTSGQLQEGWNQLGTLPAMTACGAILSNAPHLQINQQNAVLRNLMLATSNDIAQLLIVLNRPVAQQQLASVTLMQGQSLQDIAAQVTGNADNWVEIAALNNLSPPYIVYAPTSGPLSNPNSFIPPPGTITTGSTVLVPTAGTQISPVGAIPNYNRDFLGVDLYVGPINGSMPNWTGDFQTITGYPNLLWALGRRLQTTLGTLIYHPTYGSRIPPEVGNVQTTQTAGHIAAYGVSALKSDPRVAKVQNASAAIQANQLISFAATVVPGGFSPTPVSINETI